MHTLRSASLVRSTPIPGAAPPPGSADRAEEHSCTQSPPFRIPQLERSDWRVPGSGFSLPRSNNPHRLSRSTVPPAGLTDIDMYLSSQLLSLWQIRVSNIIHDISREKKT